MTHPLSMERILAVRAFNRFYTRHVGALKKGLLESPWSLTEARILYELAHRGECTARDLCVDLRGRRDCPCLCHDPARLAQKAQPASRRQLCQRGGIAVPDARAK